MEVPLGLFCTENVCDLSVREDAEPLEPCLEGIDEKILCVAGESRNTG